MQFGKTEQIPSKEEFQLGVLIAAGKGWKEDPVQAALRSCQPSSKHQRHSHFKPLRGFQGSTAHFMSTFIPNISSNRSSLAVCGSGVTPHIAPRQLIQTKC